MSGQILPCERVRFWNHKSLHNIAFSKFRILTLTSEALRQSFLNISLSRGLQAEFSVWQTKDSGEETQHRGPKKCDPAQQPAQVVASGAREDVQGITERAF